MTRIATCAALVSLCLGACGSAADDDRSSASTTTTAAVSDDTDTTTTAPESDDGLGESVGVSDDVTIVVVDEKE